MSKEKQFWDWFKANNSKYYFLNQYTDEGKKEKLLNEFLEALHLYCENLFFEIGGFANAPQELIISAEGDKNYFQKVEKLVSHAPKVNDWQIIAFKPPMGIDFITEYEDLKLNPKESWFLPLSSENNPKAFGIRMCFKDYVQDYEQKFLNGAYQMLDVILGEKSSASDIQYVEVGHLPTNPEDEGLIELSELPKYIKWVKTK